MEIRSVPAPLIDLAILIVVVVAAAAFAVWFGRQVLAPIIGRALDRQEDEDEGDGHD